MLFSVQNKNSRLTDKIWFLHVLASNFKQITKLNYHQIFSKKLNFVKKFAKYIAELKYEGKKKQNIFFEVIITMDMCLKILFCILFTNF